MYFLINAAETFVQYDTTEHRCSGALEVYTILYPRQTRGLKVAYVHDPNAKRERVTKKEMRSQRLLTPSRLGLREMLREPDDRVDMNSV